MVLEELNLLLPTWTTATQRALFSQGSFLSFPSVSTEESYRDRSSLRTPERQKGLSLTLTKHALKSDSPRGPRRPCGSRPPAPPGSSASWHSVVNQRYTPRKSACQRPRSGVYSPKCPEGVFSEVRSLQPQLDPSLTLTRMQYPAIVSNTGNRKPFTYAGFASLCKPLQRLNYHS